VGRLVVDTSAIVAVLVSEPERPALIRVTRGAELIAPGSVAWEVGNALAAMLKRRRVTMPEVRTALGAYDAIPLRLVDVSLHVALEFADTLGLDAYDAYVLACAATQRAPLLTLDQTLTQAARAADLRLEEVTI
jgi:predicted nucleic acid-binding protein